MNPSEMDRRERRPPRDEPADVTEGIGALVAVVVFMASLFAIGSCAMARGVSWYHPLATHETAVLDHRLCVEQAEQAPQPEVRASVVTECMRARGYSDGKPRKVLETPK